jgi:uncharacterized protein YcbX
MDGAEAYIDAKVDKRRFRANIYLDLASGRGFDEDELVGSSLRVGSKAVVSVVERDPRCKRTRLDPDTAESTTLALLTILPLLAGC